MKVRYKACKAEGDSSKFNINAMSEVIVYFEDGDCDSSYISDLDIMINDEWKDMKEAFRDKDIVPNNYNTWFATPQTPQEKERGYI